MLSPRTLVLFAALSLLIAAASQGQSWNQWRGPNRGGVDEQSPKLIDALPESGLTPQWVSDEAITTGGSGGWSSPVAADGKVYVFVHLKEKRDDVKLPEPKFPKLDDDEKEKLSDEDYKAYEEKRRDEQTRIRELQYRYTEHLHCFDTADGKLLWTNTRESRSTQRPQSSTPAVVNKVAYQLGARGSVWAVETGDGDGLWQTQLPGDWDETQYAASPVVAGGVVVVSAGKLFGLNAETGKLLWSSEEVNNQHASPTSWSSGDKHFILAHHGKQTLCLEANTGEQVWQVETQGGRSTPMVRGDTLITYGNSRKGGLRAYRLSPGGAEHLWTSTLVADEGCTPVVFDDRVIAQGDRKMVSLDLETGKPHWRATLDMARPRYTSLIAADDKVIFAAEGVLIADAAGDRYEQLANGKINREGLLADEQFHRKALDIDELELTAEGQKKAESLWRKEIDSAGPAQCVTPAIADGRLFLKLRSNRLACYDLRLKR